MWFCPSCHGNAIAESTRSGETTRDILESEQFNSPADTSEDLFDHSAEYNPPIQSTNEEPDCQFQTHRSLNHQPQTCQAPLLFLNLSCVNKSLYLGEC